MHAFLQNLSHALRRLRNSLGFSLTAIIILALGIGAVTAVFSIVQAVLLNPFALRDPGQLVVIRETIAEMRNDYPMLPDSYLHYRRLKATSKTLEDAAIFQDFGVGMSAGNDRPQIVGSLVVSDNFLPLLGVKPILGRNFTPEETAEGSKSDVVLLTYTAWQKYFNRDRNAIGRSIRISGEPKTVIGILPSGFRFPHIAIASNMDNSNDAPTVLQVIQPLVPQEEVLKNDMGGFNYKVIGRLKPGVTVAQAQAELQGLQEAHTQAAHLPMYLGIAVQPFAADVTGGVSKALWLLFAAVGAVLLIACVNLANLQLARAVSRQHEIAVRTALGAGRRRLLQSSLAESLVLAVAGGGLGIFLAAIGIRLFLAAAPTNLPRLQEVHLNWTILLFAAAVSILTAVLFGTLPAFRSLRVQPQQAIQNNAMRTANTREGAGTRNLLVAAEVACTMILLLVTALVIRSFARVLDQDRGFSADHITVAQVNLDAPQYGDSNKDAHAAKINFTERALDRLRQLPGVNSVAITSAMPLTGDTWVADMRRPDHPLPDGQVPKVNARWISPDYFAAMKIPLIAGRTFHDEDKNNPAFAIVSEGAARAAWPGESPIGRQIGALSGGPDKLTVVGIVADTRTNNLKRVTDTVYVPFWNRPPREAVYLIRSSLPTEALAASIRREIWNIDPQVAIPTLKSMDEQVGDSVALERFQTMLLSSFGIAALCLALLGVYGVLSYAVSLRAQEMGIRIALGAGKSELVGMILRQALLPVLSGLVVGLITAMVLARTLQSLLYETKPADPVAIAASIGILLARFHYGGSAPCLSRRQCRSGKGASGRIGNRLKDDRKSGKRACQEGKFCGCL